MLSPVLNSQLETSAPWLVSPLCKSATWVGEAAIITIGQKSTETANEWKIWKHVGSDTQKSYLLSSVALKLNISYMTPLSWEVYCFNLIGLAVLRIFNSLYQPVCKLSAALHLCDILPNSPSFSSSCCILTIPRTGIISAE